MSGRGRDRNLIMIALLLCVTGATVIAQEKPVPPERAPSVPSDTSRKADAQLPKIDLPEFVITGNEAITLPEFRKSLIDDSPSLGGLGMPGPGKRESTRVDLRNAGKDQLGFGDVGDGMNGKVMAGYGSYRSPFLDGWFGKSFGGSDFLFKAGYASSDGYIPNTDFRRGYLSMSGGTYISEESSVLAGARVGAGLGFQGNSYRLYGTSAPTTKRTVNRSSVDLSANSSYGEIFTYKSGLFLRTASVNDFNKTSETALGAELSGNWDFDGLALRGDVALWTDFYDAPSAVNNPYLTQFGLSVRKQLMNDFDVMAGGGAYIGRGSNSDRVGKVYPKLLVSWFITDRVSAFANYTPHIQRGSLSNLVEESPYVINDADVRNTDVYTDLALGTELHLATSVTARMVFGYKQMRNNAMYADPLGTGMWIPQYFGSTRVRSVEGELFVDVTRYDHLGATAAVRGSRNSITGQPVPYLPLAQFSALYEHRFPFGLTLGTAFRIVGKQYTDLIGSQKLPAFTLLDFKAEYEIVRQLRLAFMLNNILDQQQVRWKGYRGIPRSAGLGLSLSW